MKKVVIAYSGGLDTSFCAKYLSADQGFEVHAVSVNTGALQNIFQLTRVLKCTLLV